MIEIWNGFFLVCHTVSIGCMETRLYHMYGSQKLAKQTLDATIEAPWEQH